MSDQDRHAEFLVEALKVVALARPGEPPEVLIDIAFEMADMMLDRWYRKWATDGVDVR